MADLQAIERITAIAVILLHQEVLAAALQASLDDSGHIQSAFANLSKLHNVGEVAHELHHAFLAGEVHAALGDGHLTDAVILQVDQTDAAGILLDELNRVLAAAVDPVAVQLKAHSRNSPS